MCPEVVPPLKSHVPHGSIGQLAHTPSGVCVCVRPHIIEVKRVYDMCQHIFSSEESMCWSFIIYSLSMLSSSCHKYWTLVSDDLIPHGVFWSFC